MKNSKLTSVKIIESLYNKFKVKSVGTDMTLQKLTNRCVDLYLKDEKFKKIVDANDDLTISGSKL
jgi:hypothetical protein|tara:strand:- start:748 stop:942 length:195 start_codon:yes stop_codon:yes gene_type:complete